jgi:alkyl hydroperoxide reductase subunit AhpC
MIDIGENIKEDGKKVSEFVEKYADKKFPYYFDPKGNLLRNFGIIERNSNQYTLPVTVVMDAKLRVLYMLKGEVGDDFPQILWEGL